MRTAPVLCDACEDAPGSHDVTFDFNRRKREPTMNVGGRSKRPHKYGA